MRLFRPLASVIMLSALLLAVPAARAQGGCESGGSSCGSVPEINGSVATDALSCLAAIGLCVIRKRR